MLEGDFSCFILLKIFILFELRLSRLIEFLKLVFSNCSYSKFSFNSKFELLADFLKNNYEETLLRLLLLIEELLLIMLLLLKFNYGNSF